MTPPTAPGLIDHACNEAASKLDTWLRTTPAQRISLLDALSTRVSEHAADQVRVACAAKGLEPDTNTASEEWLAGPVSVLRNLRLLRVSLGAIARGQRPSVSSAWTLPSNRQVARTHPLSFKDGMLLPGFSAEVWMRPGLELEELEASRACAYFGGEDADGGTCAVLGAGNVASIGAMDVLHELFVRNRTCVLKLHPVNDYLGRFVELSFAPLIQAGFLQLVYGGAAEGQRLVNHDAITAVHITGGQPAHDAIVWGADPDERARRIAANEPLLQKDITSELGCVTPIVLAPGVWTQKELDWQARNVASMLANNASFNCNSAKLLVCSQAWPQREQFLQALRDALAATPARRAYYPGAHERFDRFHAANPDAWIGAGRSERDLPWALAVGVDHATDALSFREEAWCGFLSEVALPEDGPAFFDAAARFCNERVWGNLSCGVIAPAEVQADRERAHALDALVEALRYGTVAVNHWPALGYGLVGNPWGAFPGNSLADVQSGIGFVHNTCMHGQAEKTVVRGPIIAKPTPPWLVGHRGALGISRRLGEFEARGSVLKLPLLALAALKS